MKLAAIVPVRSLAGGKARLAGVLDDKTRAALNAAFLSHTLGLTGAAMTFVVSPDPDVIVRAKAAGVTTVPDPGNGLNPAIAAGLAAAREKNAERMVIVAIDLPCATPQDILSLLSHSAPVVIAPDRRGTGTNALCLAADLPFETKFGKNSFRAHIAEGRRLGAPTAIRPNQRLGLDIDIEADWEDWGRRVDRLAWIDAQAPR